MKKQLVRALVVVCGVLTGGSWGQVATEIPEPLRPWEDWVRSDIKDADSPKAYDDAKRAFGIWPSELKVSADRREARFSMRVELFSDTWMPLPGSAELWPVEVKGDGLVLPVVERRGRPVVRLGKGGHQLNGRFNWKEMPQKLSVPMEIGLVVLEIDGQAVEVPARDEKGALWLKRSAAVDAAQKDYLATKVHALLEDGIPLRWQSEIEMIVSGRSREEEIGVVLPMGWKLSAIQSPIPVAVDDEGKMKAQVRAGRWTVRLGAFRNDPVTKVEWSPRSGFPEVLVAFRSKPDFRMVEVGGALPVDVSQVSFPQDWKSDPVFRWEINRPLEMTERVRGMGQQRPQGVSIQREWWLDENGSGLTFRDQITGSMQQIWRLDAGDGLDVGSVRVNGEGQLITRHPETGALGVEVRDRNMNLEATGRIGRSERLSATGWQVDAQDVRTTLHLPPGWRLFALFGADSVEGDWLTEWTLLDLFLLLLFTLAVFRLWGWKQALLAFFAFGLSYHESGAPKMVWLFLLIPLALLRVVGKGRARKWLLVGKWMMVLFLVLLAVPFVKGQIQQAIYPQLEADRHRENGMRSEQQIIATYQSEVAAESDPFAAAPDSKVSGFASKRLNKGLENLAYDAKARIQTGPGVPAWSWREVSFRWNGPVSPGQSVTPILIPQALERVLSVARVVLLVGLAACLLRAGKWSLPVTRAAVKVACAAGILILSGAAPVSAQFPGKDLLDELRGRLADPGEAFPGAADLRHLHLKLDDRRLGMRAEYHVAARCAVPLPGRLPAWSPLNVRLDGADHSPLLLRDGGHLWVVLDAGVHTLQVEGLLPGLGDWQWTSPMVPRRLEVDAPGWNVGGMNSEGAMISQLLFSRMVKEERDSVGYESPNLKALVGVERQLELGLVWQVRTVVRRLAENGPAVSLRIPLLPGENVVSDGAVVKDGLIDVNLGANQSEFSWTGEMVPVDQLPLRTRVEDNWTERWLLVASPIWNVTMSGLPPVFEAGSEALVPVWTPWPGELVTLAICRPVAVAGETITVDDVSHKVEVGRRQRASSMDLTVRASLGDRLLVTLPEQAVADELSVDGRMIPVRREGANVIVPVNPGKQSVSLKWKTDSVLGTLTKGESVVLPVAVANLTSTVQPPEDRWILWTQGPQRGPAVRFWSVLVVGLLAACALARIPGSPLKWHQWMLLSVGLTQVPLAAALIVAGWLFFLAWRGTGSFEKLQNSVRNSLQFLLVMITLATMGIFIAIVSQGLLGSPEMFILGNGSTRHDLRWYEPQTVGMLAQPVLVSVSIWWYRLLMLLWALWLAASLVHWLAWGWRQFSQGGIIHREPKKRPGPPALP